MNKRVIEENQKEFLNRGDIVHFKGVENPMQKVDMKVVCMEWEKDDEGNIVFEKGKRKPVGVMVQWHNERGDLLQEIQDTRSVYKVKRKGQYHLIEAKKFFVEEGNTEIVELLNNVLNKCN